MKIARHAKILELIENYDIETQDELAQRINLMGYEDMTPLIISRIEKNQRHVCDAELKVLSKALNVSMEWLCGAGDDLSDWIVKRRYGAKLQRRGCDIKKTKHIVK